MPRLISDVLGAVEPEFTHTIMEWEMRSGHPSHDVRLITDIHRRRKSAADALGLDHDDTTARELYFMLRSRAFEDSQKFSKELAIDETASVSEMLSVVIKYIENLSYPRELWVAKQSFIKSVLRTNPPKKLMKLLGLRSIDSVIKRANVSEFLIMAYGVEGESWRTKLCKSYKKLRASDLQTSKCKIIVASNKSLEKLSGHNEQALILVRPNFETGTLLVTPPKSRFGGDALVLTLAILEAMSELRIYSAYFRHISVNNDFGLKFADALMSGLPSLEASAHTIGWRDFQRYVAEDTELFESIKQPHFQKEDIVAPSAVETLANIWPILEFWKPLQAVFHYDSTGLVSCHLIDILGAAVNGLEPEQLPRDYMRARLWQELGAKYLSEKHLQPELLKNIV